MSLEANTVLGRRYFEEVIHKGDIAAIDESIATNHILTLPGSPTPIFGPEGFKHLLLIYASAFPDLRWTMEEVTAQGETVVARLRARGTHQRELIPSCEQRDNARFRDHLESAERRYGMYYRVAIQLERDQRNRPTNWQWKSTVLSSLQTLFQFLRLYSALPQNHLRVFCSSSREGLEEQLIQENKGLGSASVTAAQFLQKRMIQSPGVMSESESREHQGATSLMVSTRTGLDESSRSAHTLGKRSMSSLEMQRLELELGTGGDHDVPYCFALSLSMPQVFAWVRLLARVYRGELRP